LWGVLWPPQRLRAVGGETSGRRRGHAGTAAAAPGPRPTVLRPTPNTLSVEELLFTTPFQSFPVHHWGQRDFEFFGQKILAVQRTAVPLGSIIGGSTAHTLNFFEFTRLPVTREIDDFRQNFGFFFRRNGPSYSYQIFTTYDAWGSPYNAIKISTLTPKNFEKLGKNFLGGGGPRAPWGQNFRG